MCIRDSSQIGLRALCPGDAVGAIAFRVTLSQAELNAYVGNDVNELRVRRGPIGVQFVVVLVKDANGVLHLSLIHI